MGLGDFFRSLLDEAKSLLDDARKLAADSQSSPASPPPASAPKSQPPASQAPVSEPKVTIHPDLLTGSSTPTLEGTLRGRIAQAKKLAAILEHGKEGGSAFAILTSTQRIFAADSHLYFSEMVKALEILHSITNPSTTLPVDIKVGKSLTIKAGTTTVSEALKTLHSHLNNSLDFIGHGDETVDAIEHHITSAVFNSERLGTAVGNAKYHSARLDSIRPKDESLQHDKPVKRATESIASSKKLVSIVADLEMKDSETQKKALAYILEHHPETSAKIGLSKGAPLTAETIQKAQQVVTIELEGLSETMGNLYNANERAWNNWRNYKPPVAEELTREERKLSERVIKPDGGLADDAARAQKRQMREFDKRMKKATEEQAKAASESGLGKYIPAFIHNLIKHHDNFIGLEHNSLPMNFAIGTAQTMLGGLLASYAFRYTGQAISGETVSLKLDKDEQGHATRDLVVTKLSPQARILMGALGVAGMATGAGGFFLGLRTQFYNFGKPMVMHT